MNTLVRFLIPVVMVCCVMQLSAQVDYQTKIKELEAQRELVVKQEKEALKTEITRIDGRLEAGQISLEEAQGLKEAAAEKHALNINNRQAIIDNEIALLERNKEDAVAVQDSLSEKPKLTIMIENIDKEDDCEFFGIGCDHWDWDWDGHHRYDKRTFSDLVIAFGLSNADIEGASLEDTPYKVAGSRFFEIGWNWRTRVFQNSNWLRFHYGFLFQFNGIKPKDNAYFVNENGETTLQEFEYELRKSKFRMDNLVVPVHFEVGPSRKRVSENRIRYSLKNQFRFGFGGYAGINLGARQKLKYTRDGDRVKDKLKGGYDASDFVYGLSTYIGAGGTLLYFKYDLNPIFQNTEVKEQFIALGLRLDI
jgi:hypothetical protein